MSYLPPIKAFLDIVGYASTVIVVAGALYAGYLVLSGFVPVLIRLGNGLKKRKIAIFAKGDAQSSLNALFKDSDLFDEKNVVTITDVQDIGRAEKASIFLVHWPDWSDSMPQILSRKRDRTALIIYAPQGRGLLPAEAIAELEKHRNVVLANLRGRLLNDVVTSLITTGYEKAKN